VTTTDAHVEGKHHHEHVAAHTGHGPSDGMYVRVALFLALLTALEVSTYYVDFGPLFLPVLLILMVIKFVMVVLFFMHLRFDSKMFGRLFWSGLILAVAVYIGTLTSFEFWA
jgi:cytochrome c oxidase subunit 4